MKITSAQITRLQTCCSQMARHVVGFSNSRDARLAWAAGLLGRPVDSFAALSLQEARQLIDAAQGELGHRAPLSAAASRPQTRPRRNADAARRAGLDGRKDDSEFSNSPELVSGEDLETIAGYYQRLGWDRVRFDAWLGSKSSPIRPRTTIRTTRDANRVRWALKGMLQERGLWVDWSAA